MLCCATVYTDGTASSFTCAACAYPGTPAHPEYGLDQAPFHYIQPYLNATHSVARQNLSGPVLGVALVLQREPFSQLRHEKRSPHSCRGEGRERRESP